MDDHTIYDEDGVILWQKKGVPRMSIMTADENSPAHGLGMIAKFIVGILVWAVSIVFSLMFFISISPPDNPAFPFMAISLTEGGFILWMVVFLCTNHNSFNKIIAMLMACASALTSLTLAGTQFYVLLATHLHLAGVPWLYPTVSIALEAMFDLNCLVVVIELIGWYFKQPGHEFWGKVKTQPKEAIEQPREMVALAQTATIEPQRSKKA